MKQDPDLSFLSAASCVALQQTLRHQHRAFAAFFGKRARYPSFKSRRSRQSAHYTRSAFTMRAGVLRVAKISAPLRFVWLWPDVDLTVLDPAMVIISREPDGRCHVTFTIDDPDPEANTRDCCRTETYVEHGESGSTYYGKDEAPSRLRRRRTCWRVKVMIML
jgi:putative transposase